MSSAASPATSSSTATATAANADPDPSDHRTSFLCQRCLQPLRVHPSLLSMDEHTAAEVRLRPAPAPEFTPAQEEGDGDGEGEDEGEESSSPSRAGRVDLAVPPLSLGESGPGPGFTLVGEGGEPAGASSAASSSSASGATVHSRLKAARELFDLASSGGRLDHPLCEECTDGLLEDMNSRLRQAEREAQAYQRHLQQMEKETEEGDSQVEQLRRELEGLEAEEEGLVADLERLRGEQERAEEEFRSQTAARDRLEQEEIRYWKEYSRYKRELLSAEDDYRSLDCKLRYAQSQLERLRKMNVFNATFNIWHTGHFATINGFRLGRLPSVPVEWAEINAAWGQTAFLLSSLARAVGMEGGFQRYQIVPYGNYSYIKVLSDGKSLPLHGSGGFRMIFDSRFDSAMAAFLDCLQQFADEVERQGGFSLPYEMVVDKGKIRDNNTGQYYSVKLQFNSEDSWTKALRYMLTNLKWGLAFVSSKHMKQEDEEEEEEEDDGGGAGDSSAATTKKEEET